MSEPLATIAEQAWNEVKLDHQPDWDELGVEYRAGLLEWARHARSGQPIKDGAPGESFERKVVELSRPSENFFDIRGQMDAVRASRSRGEAVIDGDSIPEFTSKKFDKPTLKKEPAKGSKKK